MNLALEEGSVPVRSGVRPLNPDQRDNLKEQIDDWVIKPCSSPWASPLVPVKKKDGRTRWVTNLRTLNKVTKKDAYPLPSITENFRFIRMPFGLSNAGSVYSRMIHLALSGVDPDN